MWILILLAAQLWLGDAVLNVEIADTEQTRRAGLMGRRNLAENAGMLFVYDEPKTLVFWMKRTYIPLAIGFFDEARQLINVEEMALAPPFASTVPLYRSRRAAKYALEVSPGWFERHQIQIGTKFEFKSSEVLR